jgi:hypothetical protein
MSGYEKSPNYGGPNPSWREAVVMVLVFVLVIVAIAGAIWALRRLLLAWGHGLVS